MILPTETRRTTPTNVKMKVLIGLALALGGLAPAQTGTLNVSHDLTQLKIAAQNMTPDSPTLDSRPLLNAAVLYAQANSITQITADPGAYYFLTGQTSSRYLNFTNIQNLTIDLAGSDLYFQSGSWTALECDGCQNVQFSNFTMDALQLPFTQVQVTSVDTKNNRIAYAAVPGWEALTNFNTIRNPTGASESLYAFAFRNGSPLRTTSRMAIQKPVDPAYLTAISDGSPWSNPSQLASILPGDIVTLSARGAGPTLAIRNGSGNTLKNISVYFGSQVGVVVQASPNALVDQVQVIPRPGTDRLMSTNADGISPIQLGQNLTIQRCRILRTGDDGISPNSQQLAVVVSQPSTRTVIVNRSAYSIFANGLGVQFIDNKTGLAAVTPTIVSQDPPYSTATPTFGGAVTITFDRDIPTLAANDAMVYGDVAFRGGGLVIQNNLVQDVLQARGVSLWGLLGGVVQGNMIRNVPWSGFHVIEQESTQTWMTGPVANLTLQRNAIEQFSTAFGTAVVGALGGIDIEADDLNFAPIAGSPLQNINVLNNFVSTGPYSGVRLSNVAGSNLSGNLLMNVATNPTFNNPSAAFASLVGQPLSVTASTNVTQSANTIDTSTQPAYVFSSISFSNQALAPNSWAAVFGTNLSAKTDLAGTNPLPQLFDGVSVTIVDSSGATQTAPILFVSPTQVNFLVPGNCAIGAATVTVTSNGTIVGRGAILIDSLAPALFSNDGSGTGTALGVSVLTHADGTQSSALLTQPVNIGGAGDVATLVLYATGLRGVASQSSVAVYVGNKRLPVQYAGAQGTFFGLDQINVNLPAQLAGSGLVNLHVVVGGLSSNTVTIRIN